MHQRKIITVGLLLIITGGLYFSCIYWLLPRESFYSPDSGVKFIQLKEMIAQHQINPAIPYPGLKVDQQLTFQPLSWLILKKDQKLYSHYSPLYPWLCSLFYRHFQAVGLYVISFLAGVFSLWVMYAIAQFMLDESQAFLSMLLLGLGTPLLFYFLEYWEHSLAVCLTTIAILLLLKSLDGKTYSCLMVPVVALLAFWSRSESVVFLLAIFAAALILFIKKKNIRFRQLIAPLLVTGGILFSFILFNLFTSGTLFGIHVSKHLFSSYAFRSIIDPVQRVKVIATLYGRAGIGAYSPAEYVTTAMTMLAFMLIIVIVIAVKFRPSLSKKTQWRVVLSMSLLLISAAAVMNIVFRFSVIGLFQVTPFVIFAPLYLIDQDRSLFARFIKLSVLFYFFSSLFIPNIGGTQWGPRYILSYYPLLIICSWNALDTMHTCFGEQLWRFGQRTFVFLTVCSCCIQGIGVSKLHAVKVFNRETRNILQQASSQVILANYEHFLASICPDLYDQKMFFHVKKQNIHILIKKLYEQDITQFSVASSRAISPDARITMEDILAAPLPDNRQVFFVKSIYRDQTAQDVVLQLFEIR